MYEFVRPRNSDNFGRYYTNDLVSNALVSSIKKNNPKTLLDLGTGSGNLAIAARNKWSSTKIVTLDIQPKSEISLKKAFALENSSLYEHRQIDVLNYDLPSILKKEIGSLEVGISNPPFIKAKWEKRFEGILEEARISSSLPSLSDATIDVLFLAQMLRIMDNKGVMGLIVPDGIITGTRYASLRNLLIRDFNLTQVTKLPRYAFQGTDAQAYIVTFDFRESPSEHLLLNELKSNGTFTKNIKLERDTRIARLDFSFASTLQKAKKSDSANISLLDLGCDITRGKSITTDVKKSKIRPIFHTTHFALFNNKTKINLPRKFHPTQKAKKNGQIHVEKGDIILARVDRSLERKIALVNSGEALISDCVFRLRVPVPYRAIVFSSLTSCEGRKWIKSISQGVSATMISKTQLFQFKIKLEGKKNEK